MTNCWGGHRQPIDAPGRLRKLTLVRHRIGERRYRELRYSMDVARARLDIIRLAKEMGRIKAELALHV